VANPMMILKISGIKKDNKNSMEGRICELISKAFTTRNLLHFAHWNTKSFASHMALGDLYDQIIEDIDEIVETYQGKFGLVEDLYCEAAKLPKDITNHVKEEAQWVEDNRMFISKGETSIENLIDTLIGHYHKTTYKLENLH
jgi:DNA-binding ferritin-like protein